MTNKANHSTFAVDPEAAASIHEDGIVIFHISNGRLFSSNGTGARIWRALEKQLSLEAITSEVSDAYQIARATAGEQVVRFLGELERHMLIHREAAS